MGLIGNNYICWIPQMNIHKQVYDWKKRGHTCCIKQAQSVGLASNHYSYSIVIKHLQHRPKPVSYCKLVNYINLLPLHIDKYGDNIKINI